MGAEAPTLLFTPINILENRYTHPTEPGLVWPHCGMSFIYYNVYWHPQRYGLILEMARKSGRNRRESTIIRDNSVHTAYRELCASIGNIIYNVSKAYIYEELHKRTGLCSKTIAYILNHTEEVEISEDVK